MFGNEDPFGPIVQEANARQLIVKIANLCTFPIPIPISPEATPYTSRVHVRDATVARARISNLATIEGWHDAIGIVRSRARRVVPFALQLVMQRASRVRSLRCLGGMRGM